MTLVRGLYLRFRQLIHEAAKFGVVGVFGLLVTNGVYALMHEEIGLGIITSTTIATIVATTITFVGNRYWSFRHRERTGVARETVIFFVLNGIGLLIQDAVVGFNAYVLGYEHNRTAGFLALNCGIALATLFRFWSYRKFVWAALPPAAGTGPVGARPLPDGPSVAPEPLAPQRVPDRGGDEDIY